MTMIVSKRVVAVAAILVGIPALPAIAAPMTMTCRNATRSYFVKFDRKARTFFANETKYTVLAVEDAGGKLVVAGTTVNDGPAFKAEFRPSRRVEFYINAKIFQTDGCR